MVRLTHPIELREQGVALLFAQDAHASDESIFAKVLNLLL